MGARDAAAEDDDVGSRHAWHAAEQHATASCFLFKTVRADLRRKPPATSDIGVSSGKPPEGDVTVS